jgi:peptide/nickel transport system substrate-binding protein
MSAAAKELDAKKREQEYYALQRVVADQGPFIIMFQNTNQVASREGVKGFKAGITEDLNFYRLITK